MNHCIPHWNMADERSHFSDHLSGSSQKKSTGPNPELLELLWRNGHVVTNSQTHRKPTSAPNESKPIHRPEHPLKLGGSSINSSNLIQEDETASWLQYPLEDSLEKDFCSDFFYDIPTVDAIKENPAEDVRLRSQPFFKQCSDLRFAENNIPPPELQGTDAVVRRSNLGSGRVVNFSHFSRLFKAGEEGKGAQVQGEMGESSVMTVGSSHCGSNQVQYQANLSPVSNIFPVPVKEGVQRVVSQRERGCNDTVEPTTTLSSGGSGGSLGRTGKQTSSNQSHKRKSRDGDASECQSEDAEYESVEASKPAPRSASARRRRAAEVHNLSERRRRDRINEKMRELQELIPHCNKSDKASMLDEAIEYLKSLQMQVQIMWIGSGMAPMMYPSMQHYMSRMSMGMGAAPVPPVHGHLQLPRVSLVNQSMPSPTPNQPTVAPSPVLNAHNFQNQVQSLNLPESYARFFGFHPMQMNQAMNLFPYGSQQIQPIPNQRIAQPTSLEGACNGGVLSDNAQTGNLG